jgi:uncharacterized SAM-binding protein YcdF (DUF218 family)
MPRAIACYRKAGFSVTAAPADWGASHGGDGGSWSASGNLSALDLAVREYIALLVYGILGRT